MKILLALMFTLSAFSVFAAEVDSRCEMLNDSRLQTETESTPIVDNADSSGDAIVI